MSGILTDTMDDPDKNWGHGDPPSSLQNLSYGHPDSSSYRSLGNGHSSPVSPLKLFGQAKKQINDIFKHIKEYIEETEKFYEDATRYVGSVVSEEVTTSMKGYTARVQGITEVLCRDHMKVVLFGRTSNGKSTVINAMLRDKILPSGIGHTTNCFLQVEGSDTSEGFLLTEDSDQPKSISNIKQLASSLSSVKLQENSLIRILWPKDKCRLLREDVVLLDSPGVDVSPDLDSWIDKFCLDADVFVLVANAESTLMQTEKNFFHKVSSRLSKPNLFVIQNRWDVSVNEEDAMEVKNQHLDRNVQFLADELKVMTRSEAKDRVFFVSAREALLSRLHQDRGTSTPVGALQEGFQGRLFEFSNFERKFEECISKSAVKTKFEQHSEGGKLLMSELRLMMEETYDNCVEQMDDKTKFRQEKADRLDYLDKQLRLLSNETKEKIKAMVEDVERKVSAALNEEIRRLAIVVDEFDRPFHPDQMLLNVYKKELHAHVEEGLGRNLQSRCSAALMHGVETTQREMTDRMSPLMEEDTRHQLLGLIPKREFEIAYRLDCRNLCADFREDIQFRFSFGLTALMQRFLGTRGTRSVMMGFSDSIPRPLSTSSPDYQGPSQRENEVLVTVLTTFASLTSRTTLGAIAVTGVIAKAAGWRVLGVAGALYGLLYFYERLTWTNRAKERSFKQQYVDYASSKLRLIVDLTSSNCSHQVQQELCATFARLCHQIDLSKQGLSEEIRSLDKEMISLKDVSGKAKTLRNKADWVDKELSEFIEQFLRSDG